MDSQQEKAKPEASSEAAADSTQSGEGAGEEASAVPASDAAPSGEATHAENPHSEGAKASGKLAAVRAFFKDLFDALFSKDAPTRRTALLFFISCLGVIVVLVLGIQRISQMRARRALEAKELAAEQKRLADLQNNRLADLTFQQDTLDLGRFVVSLKSPDGGATRPTADFELFVRCNNKEVRDYVEARTVQVRSELTSSLVGMTREDFLALDGKRKTHKKILTTLNQWLAREYSGARIEEIWFSNLVVE
jgi:flagellar basal body-associated protein FliL